MKLLQRRWKTHLMLIHWPLVQVVIVVAGVIVVVVAVVVDLVEVPRHHRWWRWPWLDGKLDSSEPRLVARRWLRRRRHWVVRRTCHSLRRGRQRRQGPTRRSRRRHGAAQRTQRGCCRRGRGRSRGLWSVPRSRGTRWEGSRRFRRNRFNLLWWKTR